MCEIQIHPNPVCIQHHNLPLSFCIRFQGWSWHDCHQHWHYDNYAHYALRGLCSSGDVAWEDRPVVGHKNGWCAILSIIYHT